MIHLIIVFILKKLDDSQDGDLMDQVSYSDIDTSTVGKKTVHYSVEDQVEIKLKRI